MQLQMSLSLHRKGHSCDALRIHTRHRRIPLSHNDSIMLFIRGFSQSNIVCRDKQNINIDECNLIYMANMSDCHNWHELTYP